MTLSTLKSFRRAAGLLVITAMVCVAGTAVFRRSTTNRDLGSVANVALNQPIVGVAATPTGNGYWLVAADGGVFTFGDAHYFGSTGNRALNAPIIGLAATPSGKGYWLLGADGGVFTFGDAHFYGSTGARKLAAPIAGIARTRSGRGYWLVARDGGVFTFGDARFFGSAAGHAAAPVIGMAMTRSGSGYWIATDDARVYNFGDAPAQGSAKGLSAPVIGIARQHVGNGYWLAASDGSTSAAGKARSYGTQFAVDDSSAGYGDPVVTIAGSPKGGYWVATNNGAIGVSTTHKAAKPSAKATGMIAYQLFQKMNAERTARHMAPFGWDRLLSQRATSWARTLIATHQFKHQDLSGIANAAGGRFEEVGENLFSGSGGAADAGTAHVALMQSPDHRANVLMRQGQLVGIAAVCSGNTLMVVEDFAIKMGAPLPPGNLVIPPAQPVAAPSQGGAGC
jgi:hypothetical protein